MQITVVNDAADAILEMASPASAAEISGHARAMAQHAKNANDSLIVGVDNIDLQAIENVGIAWDNAINRGEQLGIARLNFCN